MKALIWVARIVSAVIMLQTLYFKFTGASESIEIFSKVGMEPWGRYGVGLLELIASVLLLIPGYSWLGAGLGAGLMAGAIGMHVLILGIEVQGDGGQLFYYALIVAIGCTIVLVNARKQVRATIQKILTSSSGS